MKITFVSNFLNHHQLPFCKEMYERNGKDFKFIATERIPDDRLKLGYDDMNNIYPFVIRSYDSADAMKNCINLCYNSDAVIIGSAPDVFIHHRLKDNKLTFRYSERIFKDGVHKIWHPNILYYLFKNHTIYKNKKLYMLCSSAYTAFDFSLINAYRNKCYKWGYFPEVVQYKIKNIIEKKEKNDCVNILWVGRLIDWKHPEKAIMVANELKKKKVNFKLHIIGTGPLEKKLLNMIDNLGLVNEVVMTGAVNNKDVRTYMLNANIFLFTSDYNEGWGAVLNEAMNSGCAVIASHAIGSVPYLIKNNFNGLVYKNNNINDLYNSCFKLISNQQLRIELGENAYNTLNSTWNAKVAADRLEKLVNSIINKNEFICEDGPCSKAECISQFKMYNYVIKRGE